MKKFILMFVAMFMMTMTTFAQQTTVEGSKFFDNTYVGVSVGGQGCILFHFYIKPQLNMERRAGGLRCILFHFYIKPQPMAHKTLFSSTLSPKSHSHFQRNAVV